MLDYLGEASMIVINPAAAGQSEWPAIAQAVTAAVALWLALTQPGRLARRRALDDLIAYQRLGRVAERLIAAAMKEHNEVGAFRSVTDPLRGLEFKVCREALDAVPLGQVQPATLIEPFVELRHMTERAQRRAEGSGAMPPFEVSTRAANAMSAINQVLRREGVVIDSSEGFAQPPDRWTTWRRLKARLRASEKL